MIDFTSHLEEISSQLSVFKQEKRTIFATSSFQTNSVVLLHIIARCVPEIPVYMMNTGFLFPETLMFRDRLIREFGLNVVTLKSQTPPLQQRCGQGRFLFASDPDACCHINKIVPLEPIIAQNDVWINGVRGSQSATRKAMKKLQPTQRILRYHPLLDWDSRMVYYYLEQNNLPKHPLEDEGFVSIGCRPCTRKWADTLDDRGGRWAGLNKSECGLHTTLGS
jgi:phosphoadenosine phosphosulfate reductase